MNIWVLSRKYDRLMNTSYLIAFKLNQYLVLWFLLQNKNMSLKFKN
jgi:hypothetical protein